MADENTMNFQQAYENITTMLDRDEIDKTSLLENFGFIINERNTLSESLENANSKVKELESKNMKLFTNTYNVGDKTEDKPEPPNGLLSSLNGEKDTPKMSMSDLLKKID